MRADAAGWTFCGLWRATFVGLSGFVLLWLSLSVTVSGILSMSRPDVVLAWWPWSADAAAARSAELADQQPSGAARGLVVVLARQALARQIISPIALRTLAISAAYADPTGVQTQRLLATGEAFSRRDLPTQLMLIELNVQRGNVAGALVHYDRAMRSSPEVRPKILPILVAAVNDPVIARSVARLLMRDPSWRDDFVTRMVRQVDNPRSIAVLLQASRLSSTSPVDRNLIEVGIDRIAERGASDLAFRMYRSMSGRPPRSDNVVVDGDFRAGQGLKPFDWALNDDASLLTTLENGPAGGRLHTSVAAGADGWLARQMLLVSSGRYALATHIAGSRSDGSTLNLSLRCLNGVELLSQPWRGGDGIAATIAVPAGCRAAWLTFEGRGPIDNGPSEYVIGSVSLRRR